MKNKFICILIAIMFAVNMNGQIYSKTEYLDKFDDVQKTLLEKTIISVTDSTVIFETKGKKSTVFHRLSYLDGHIGTSDKPENLNDDVYGYAYIFYVSDENVINIVHKIITERYTRTFITDLWWICKSDGSRIIFRRK